MSFNFVVLLLSKIVVDKGKSKKGKYKRNNVIIIMLDRSRFVLFVFYFWKDFKFLLLFISNKSPPFTTIIITKGSLIEQSVQ